MADDSDIFQLDLDPKLPLVEVKPRKLSSRERKTLLQLLRRDSADAAFDEVVVVLERELGAFVIRRRQSKDKKVTPAQARQYCQDVANAARRLQSAWNKAPTESLQLLDFHYQRQHHVDNPTADEEPIRFHRNFTAIFSELSTPFFMNLEQSMEKLVKVSERAATPSKKQAAGGRPLNPPLIFFVRSVAQAFVSILGQMPTITRTGPFSQTVHWALDLVSGDDQVKSVPRHIKRAVEEIKANSET